MSKETFSQQFELAVLLDTPRTKVASTSIGRAARTRPIRRIPGLASALVLTILIVLPAGLAGADETMDANLTEAFGHLGFNEYDSMEIINRSVDTEDVRSFRYAANLDPATIASEEAAWGFPARMGVTWVTWTDRSTIPSFPDHAQVVDGALYLPRGGPIPDIEYVVMWAQMGGPIPIDDPMEFFQNWSFPTGVSGQPKWNPLSQFPLDTWGGASVIPYITYGPNPWGFFTSVVQEDGSLADLDFIGGALIYGDVIIAFVEVNALFPNGHEGSTFSFAGHIHDGTYGANPSSKSLVTFATGTPGDLVEMPTTDMLVVGSGTPPPTTSTSTTTTTVAESESAAAATTSTIETTAEATGEEQSDAAGFPWWIVILIGLIILIYGGWLYFSRGNDDGDDPRDTPPPVAYGEVIEQMQCDWAVYFDDKNRGLVALREPQAGMECCKYVIRVSTEIEVHEQAARGRQDAGDDRLRMPDYDFAWDMLDFSAHGSARSGPFGRQDWMHGYGDPLDQSLLAPDHEYLQRFQGEPAPEVATHLYHREKTTIAVDLEAGCPEYDNEYELDGIAQQEMLVTQECTNNDPSPQCPVELMSAGWFIGTIGGDLSAQVYDEALGDIDDLERGSDQPKWLEMSHQHVDNLAQEKPTYTFSTTDSDSKTMTDDSTEVTVHSSALSDVGIIVPVHVWRTTERVSAHLEGSLHYGIDVDGTMTPKNCESNACGGHGQCLCRPNFKLNITTGTATITVDDEIHDIGRDPATADRNNPPPTGDEKWVLA